MVHAKTVAILCIVCLAVGAGLGVWLLAPALTQHHYSEKIIEKQVPVIQEVVKTQTVTEVQYVPKETVIVKNPDGTTTEEKEKTDVDLQTNQPAVNVRVNGQPYQFSLLQGESQKFEQGKVSLTQNSQIGIDLAIKPHVIDNTKTGGIDIFVGKYSGVTIQHKRIGIDLGADRHGATDFRVRWKAIQW